MLFNSSKMQRQIVGGITDENVRTANFTLDFLEPGKQYVATLYADGKDADYKENPTSYQIKKGIVTSKTKMSVKLARSGGFALSLIEATPSDKKVVKKWRQIRFIGNSQIESYSKIRVKRGFYQALGK